VTDATKEILRRQHVNNLSESELADAVESAERERCAKIADQWAIASGDAEQIAAAIRSGQ